MANFPGTPLNDTYFGTPDNDRIDGLAGNDILVGDTGNDTINGGDDDDYIQGGLGQDTLDGGNGIDAVDYTTFNGNGVYDLVAGTANLGVFTEQILNFESIYAGDGNDTITLPSFSSNFFSVESPINTVAGGGNDLVNGGAGYDYIFGGDGNDTINGNAGDDSLYGDAGNDIINGGDGDDYIQGGLGQDTLNGGAGIDQVDYTTFNGNGIYDLVAGTANLGVFTEQILNFETIIAGNGDDIITLPFFLPLTVNNSFDIGTRITLAGGGNDLVNGGAGDDSISGDAGNDTLYGGAGNDTLYGGIGNDFIQGGLGQDTLYGGAGFDTVDYTTFNGGGTYNLTLGTTVLTGAFSETMDGFENINTGAGNDIIYGNDLGNRIFAGAGNDVIYALDGDDYVQGGLGNDALYGGNGNDTVDYTTFSGDGTYDLTAGTANLGVSVFTETMLSFENIYTGAGNDRIFGTTGDNYLNGGAGDDDLFGNQGNDTLSGNAGDDELTGGTGIDRFLFGAGVLSATNTVAGSIGKDKIYDFTKGTDKIVLSGNAFNLTQAAFSANSSNLSFQSVANDALADISTAAIVYSEGSRSLSYNPNGTAAGFGYGGTFATVAGMAPGTSLDTSNFVIATPILTGFNF